MGIRGATAIAHKKNCKEKKNNLKNKLLFYKAGLLFTAKPTSKTK
jgi:hypothetical protein